MVDQELICWACPNSFQTKPNPFCHYSSRCTHTSNLRQQTAAYLNDPETDNPWKCL